MSEASQSLVIDLGSLTPEVSPSARQAFEWAELLAATAGDAFPFSTLTIFSTANEGNVVDAVIDTTDLVMAIDPSTHFMLYQGPNGAFDTDWYTALIADLQVARPDISLSLLSIDPLFDAIIADPALAGISRDETTDEILTGMVIYTQFFGKEMPTDVIWPDTLDPTLVAVLPTLTLAVEEAVLGPRIDPTQLIGTDADDLLVLNDAVKTVFGAEGVDTLAIGRNADSVVEFKETDGQVSLRFNDDLVVTTQDVERLEFFNGTLAYDIEGNAGQAYRLYQAVFDRTPDAEGLGFWIDQLDAGSVTLTETADFFISSEEFAENYGTSETVSDLTYLTLLYENVLDREPDPEGFAFWQEQQENGITRADMLVFFSESIENKSLVAPAIDDGIWYV